MDIPTLFGQSVYRCMEAFTPPRFGTEPRKNYLFFQSPRGARAGAVLLSLILTAKVNGLNPEQYLATLVKRFKPLKDGARALWEEILPWNIKDLEPLPKD